MLCCAVLCGYPPGPGAAARCAAPAQFLTGLYGMNFEVMPELTWKWRCVVVLGVMGEGGGSSPALTPPPSPVVAVGSACAGASAHHPARHGALAHRSPSGPLARRPVNCCRSYLVFWCAVIVLSLVIFVIYKRQGLYSV